MLLKAIKLVPNSCKSNGMKLINEGITIFKCSDRVIIASKAICVSKKKKPMYIGNNLWLFFWIKRATSNIKVARVVIVSLSKAIILIWGSDKRLVPKNKSKKKVFPLR